MEIEDIVTGNGGINGLRKVSPWNKTEGEGEEIKEEWIEFLELPFSFYLIQESLL